MNFKVNGVIVPMLTPFNEQGNLDSNATAQLANFLIEKGVAGLFPAGTTSEGPLLSLGERRQLAEIVVQTTANRIPVIVHSGAITTAETIALTQHAQQIGADAAAIIPPFYFHYADDALFQHYYAVAQAAPDFPLYLYNNPGVGNNNRLAPALVERLLDACPNIVGMKDSSGSLELPLQAVQMRGGNFNTASGGDGMILQGVAAGIDACVSGNANVVPELIVALHQAASAGDWPQARSLQQQLDQVRYLLEDGRDLSLFKAMLARRGLPVGSVRPPLLAASPAIIAKRWQALVALNPALSVL